MFCIKFFSLFVVVLCLIPEQSKVSATFWLMKCFYKPCHNYERTIFATDGSTCYVFRNSCHLRNENCRRIRSYAERLSTVTKEVCQAKCQQECPAGQGTPVCGEYAGLYTTFPSECELLRTACVNGQPIIKVRNSACPVYG